MKETLILIITVSSFWAIVIYVVIKIIKLMKGGL